MATMPLMAKSKQPPANPDGAYVKKTGKKPEKQNEFIVRENLPTDDAKREYDKYLKEHRRRLQQLERVARGEWAPSDEWYNE